MVALPGIGTSLAFGDTVFSDSTFNLGNYTQTPLYINTPGFPVITISTVANANSTANGPALDFDYSYNMPVTDPPQSLTFTGEMNNTWLYDPSSMGAITGINFSADKSLVVPGNFLVQSISAPAILEQDGLFYVAFPFGSATSGYQTISGSNLQASNFGLYDFTNGTVDTSMNPNFTASGDAIEFGIGSRANVQSYTGATMVIDGFYDNVTWDIVTTPEPNCLPLLGGMFAAFLVAWKRRPAR